MNDEATAWIAGASWLAKLAGQLPDDGGVETLGTAWLLAPDVLVTCHHCVQNYVKFPDMLSVRFADSDVPSFCVTEVCRCTDDDIALLRLKPQASATRSPLPLAILPESELPRIERIARPIGFPHDKDAPHVWGHFKIAGSLSAGGGLEDLQVSGGAVEGMSGGPFVVRVDGTSICIGMLTLGGRGRATTLLHMGRAISKSLEAFPELVRSRPSIEPDWKQARPFISSHVLPRWSMPVAIILMVAAVAIPIGLSEFRQSECGPFQNVVLPPTTDKVSYMQTLSDPDYASFDILRENLTLDLREYRDLGTGDASRKCSPATLTREIVVRMRQQSTELRFQFSTTGLGIDLECSSHPDRYRVEERGIERTSVNGRNQRVYHVVIDVSDMGAGTERTFVVRGTYWNAFQFPDGNQWIMRMHTDRQAQHASILFPQDWGTVAIGAFDRAGRDSPWVPVERIDAITYDARGNTLSWAITQPKQGTYFVSGTQTAPLRPAAEGRGVSTRPGASDRLG